MIRQAARALIVVTALAVGACQQAQAPTPAPQARPVGQMTAQLKAEGDRLAAQGRYAEAVVKYQAALNQEPASVPIRFALAVALSYLEGRRAETIEHFKFVAARGEPGSQEVRIARQWLADAGELPGVTAGQPAARAEAKEDQAKKGRLFGKIQWQGINPYDKRIVVKVTIEGDEPATRDVHLMRPAFKIGRTYEFNDLPPGRYRLVAENSGTRMWQQTVTIEPGKQTNLDLTEINALVSPTQFEPREEE